MTIPLDNFNFHGQKISSPSRRRKGKKFDLDQDNLSHEEYLNSKASLNSNRAYAPLPKGDSLFERTPAVETPKFRHVYTSSQKLVLGV